MKPVLKILLAAWLVLAAGQAALAQEEAAPEALLAGLGNGDFSQAIAAVEALAATGDPRVVPALQAMLDGKLFVRQPDGLVVVAERQGQEYRLLSPLGGQELGQAAQDDLKRIMVNNRLRGALRGALGGLTLLSPDRQVRAKAVEAVQNSRSASVLPTLAKAIERESDPALKERMVLAKASIELFEVEDKAVLAKALEVLSAHPTQEVRALLGNFAAGPAKSDPDMAKAADKALQEVERTLGLWEMVGHLYRGLSLGSVLLLAAIGLAITFGLLGVINMAHGEMVMLGAYTTYMVQELFRAYAPGAVDWSLAVAVPAAFLVAGAVGVAIERGIIRFLYGRPLETLLATWGLSLVLQQAVRSIFGPSNREVSNPSWMSGAKELLGGLVLTYNRMWIIVFSLAVVGLIALVLRKTSFGLQVRAVTQNRGMASAMGMRTGAIDALTFGLGSGIAGMAGVALSQIDNVSPNLGQAYIIDSFMVVVFGGVGNLLGTVLGAFSLGVLNKYLEPLSGAVLAKILVLTGLILFIQKRPRGLFALKGRAAEV
jgi:urea transport system permease protein